MSQDTRLSEMYQKQLNDTRIMMQKMLTNVKLREWRKKLSDSRRSGVLTGISNLNLAGNENIGTYEDLLILIDFLGETNQTLLQLLPIGPVDKEGDYSPYSSTSDRAFNPLNISLNMLCEDGLLSKEDLPKLDGLDNIDYDKVVKEKIPVLYKAYYNAKKGFSKDSNHEGYRLDNDLKFKEFCLKGGRDLDNDAIFAVLKEKFNLSWDKWSSEYKFRTGDWADKVNNEYKEEIEAQKFFQYKASEQWDKVIERAEYKNILLIGDVPAYLAHNNASVWAHPECFQLDDNKCPTNVPGVPGQIWGSNVLFNWWKPETINLQMKRFKAAHGTFHDVRFDCPMSDFWYYSISAYLQDSMRGKWEPANGWELFKLAREKFKDANWISEDIGYVPEDVRRFFNEYKFISMKVMQYGLYDNDHTPRHYPENVIAYTGTHDTLPLKAWYNNSDIYAKDWLRNYAGCNDERYINWALWNRVSQSKAKRVIIPLFDVAGLGEEGTLNVPGQKVVPGGQKCWTHRIKKDVLFTEHNKDSLKCIAEETNRVVKIEKGKGRDVRLFILPGDVLKHVDALLNKEVAVTR